METKPLSRLKQYVNSVTTKWVWRNIKNYGICTAFHWKNCKNTETRTRGEVSSLIVKNLTSYQMEFCC